MFLLNCVHKTIDVVECKVNKGVIGKVFKKDAKVVTDFLTRMDDSEVAAMDKMLKEKGYIW